MGNAFVQRYCNRGNARGTPVGAFHERVQHLLQGTASDSTESATLTVVPAPTTASTYATLIADCGYHGISQKYVREYTGAGGSEDDGVGKRAQQWLWIILREGTPSDAKEAERELMRWVVSPSNKNPHTASLVKYLKEVLNRSGKLGTADLPPGNPTFGNLASLSEVDNNVLKSQLNRRAAPNLTRQADAQKTVATTRENQKVSLPPH